MRSRHHERRHEPGRILRQLRRISRGRKARWGKKALVVGIANDESIAYGSARALQAFGADLAITYLNEKTKQYTQESGARRSAWRRSFICPAT